MPIAMDLVPGTQVSTFQTAYQYIVLKSLIGVMGKWGGVFGNVMYLLLNTLKIDDQE